MQYSNCYVVSSKLKLEVWSERGEYSVNETNSHHKFSEQCSDQNLEAKIMSRYYSLHTEVLLVLLLE